MYRSLVLGLLFASSAATGAEKIVWQIGKPDHDWHELAIAGRYQYRVTNDDMDQAVREINEILTIQWERSQND